MDHQKVEQTLKKIFDRYGRDIVKDHSRFRSAVMDLLDPVNCKDERIVLKHAMDCDAFWILLENASITGVMAWEAARRLQSEAHMTQEDAGFVVSCVAGARCGNPNILRNDGLGQPAGEPKREMISTLLPAEKKEEKTNSPLPPPAQKEANPPGRPPAETNQNKDGNILELPCKVYGKRMVGCKTFCPAKITLHRDKIVISPDGEKPTELLYYGKTELPYRDVKKMDDGSSTWVEWWIMMAMVLVDLCAGAFCFIEGESVVFGVFAVLIGMVGLLYFGYAGLMIRRTLFLSKKYSWWCVARCVVRFPTKMQKIQAAVMIQKGIDGKL